MSLLSNKTAVVFGGSGKLGKAIATRLHEEGASVVIHYHANNRAAEALAAELDPSGKTAIAIRADAMDASQVKALYGQAIKAFGSLDIVVNTVHPPFDPAFVADSKEEDWGRHLDALKSHYLISREALPQMRAQHGGRIIYVSAALAVRYGEGCSMYTTIKRGLNGFCRTLAMEEGKNNILVNIVCPGGIADAQTQQGDDWDEMAAEFIKKCPLGRLATSEEVANTVLYFASPLSEGITGQTLFVAGGEIML